MEIGNWWDDIRYEDYYSDTFTAEARSACGPVCYNVLYDGVQVERLDWNDWDDSARASHNEQYKYLEFNAGHESVFEGQKVRVDIIPYLCDLPDVSDA